MYVERLDWLAKNPRYTQRFAMHVGALCHEMTNKAVAELERLHDSTVKELDKIYMQKQVAQAGLPAPRAIGVDEIAIRKGHDYRVVVSDLERGRPIWVGGRGRAEADLDVFFAALGAKKSAAIELAAMDMWKPFRTSLTKHAPNARVVFDKFHIMRHLGDALDEVRRSEYRRLAGKDRTFIKGQRYTLLSRRENLSHDGRASLRKLLKANKRLNTAYLLKESFGQLWSYQTPGWARAFFERWKESLKWQRLTALREVHGDDRAALGRDRLLLPPRQQGQPRPGRGAQQQDPRPPAPGLRLPRRGLPQTQDRGRLPSSIDSECGKRPTVIREDPHLQDSRRNDNGRDRTPSFRSG